VTPARGTRAQRRSDLRLVAVAIFLVVAAGGLIAAGLLTAMGGSDAPTCGRLPLGAADSFREQLEGGPQFRTGGGECGFYLALDGGEIVAYKLTLEGRDCTVRYESERFWCDDEPVPSADLEQYETTIETIDDVDTLVVDLRPPEARAPRTT
jgi:hypothetical protein